MDGDEYDDGYEQYGGLVSGSKVRAARLFEKEPTDNLDEFIKALIVWKRYTFKCIIEMHADQSPDIILIYERLLADVYACMVAGTCKPDSYELPEKCVAQFKRIIDMYDRDSVTHVYWLKQMLKVAPYAYNMRGAVMEKMPAIK